MARGIWVNGRERPGGSGEIMRVLNPYDDSVVGEVALASTADVDQAIDGALTT